MSRAGMRDQLEAVGLAPNHLWDTREVTTDSRMDLISIEDFVAADDPRLQAARDRLSDDVAYIHVIGAYARPRPV